MTKLFTIPAAAVGLYYWVDRMLDDQNFQFSEEHVPDLTVEKLFSHDQKELHCHDRDLMHPCTTELRHYLKHSASSNTTSVEDEEDLLKYQEESYNCAKTVFNEMHDFYVVKNMTHLLLDLDTTDHNFDNGQNERDNKFYQLGLDFGKKLLFHEKCLEDFDTKGELECRCPHLYAKILLLKLKNAGRWTEAEELFSELKSYEWKGSVNSYGKGQAFRWRSLLQTPQVFIPNLGENDKTVWTEERRKDVPIWDVLEKNFDIIRSETLQAFETDYVEDSYRFLYKDGNWNQITLFSGRKFNTDACKVTPNICRLMKESLEARRVHHYPWTSNQNEQVLLLRTTPGTQVETHCGPANNILNVHLGISGLEGAKLVVAGQEYRWEEGKVIVWDGSYDHLVDCQDCKEDRIILMVRYMHPDMAPKHYKGQRRTHYEDIPQSLFEGEEMTQRKSLFADDIPHTPSTDASANATTVVTSEQLPASIAEVIGGEDGEAENNFSNFEETDVETEDDGLPFDQLDEEDPEVPLPTTTATVEEASEILEEIERNQMDIAVDGETIIPDAPIIPSPSPVEEEEEVFDVVFKDEDLVNSTVSADDIDEEELDVLVLDKKEQEAEEVEAEEVTFEEPVVGSSDKNSSEKKETDAGEKKAQPLEDDPGDDILLNHASE